jgi:hypothetical protein
MNNDVVNNHYKNMTVNDNDMRNDDDDVCWWIMMTNDKSHYKTNKQK